MFPSMTQRNPLWALVLIKRFWDMFDNTNTIQNIEHHIRAIFTVVRIQKKVDNAGSHKVGKPFN